MPNGGNRMVWLDLICPHCNHHFQHEVHHTTNRKEASQQAVCPRCCLKGADVPEDPEVIEALLEMCVNRPQGEW
jgi:hypothetical protein